MIYEMFSYFGGKIIPKSVSEKQIKTIKYIFTVDIADDTLEPINVTNCSIIDGEYASMYSQQVDEQEKNSVDKNSLICYNYIAKGNTVLSIPYGSDIPYNSGGKEKCYSSHLKVQRPSMRIIPMYDFAYGKENGYFKVCSGVDGYNVKLSANRDILQFDEVIYDSEQNKVYINGILQNRNDCFVGTLPLVYNADNKVQIQIGKKTKFTGSLNVFV